MNTIPVRRSIASFVSAIVLVLVLHVSPALAGGPPPPAKDDNRKRVEIPFTKWVLDETSLPFPMRGFAGGDAAGEFVGEVLDQRTTTTCDPDPAKHRSDIGCILRIEAVYEIHAEDKDRSFTALIQGGANGATGLGILDGVILGGWRTGARVHVQFQAIACTESPNGTCFQGTIQVERAPRD